MLVGDGGFAVLDLLHCCQSLAQPVILIARLRLDAALYEPAPPRQPGQNGRPPLKGRRLPALKSLVDHPGLSWATAAVTWYDGTTRTVELTSQTAVWYRSGKPPVPLRWVLVRDPQSEFATQALLCTDLAADPAQILEWFVLRWQLEVTFQEVRAYLGVETQRQWSDRAIARSQNVHGRSSHSNRLADPRQVGPRASLAACCPDNLAQHHHHGPPSSPLRGYRTLHSAKSIGIKPSPSLSLASHPLSDPHGYIPSVDSGLLGEADPFQPHIHKWVRVSS